MTRSNAVTVALSLVSVMLAFDAANATPREMLLAD